KGVGAGDVYFADYIYLNAAYLTERHLHIGIFIALISGVKARIDIAETRAQPLSGFLNAQSIHTNRTNILDIDHTIRRNSKLVVHLRRAPDIDNNFITRTQLIIFGGGNIKCGFKGYLGLVK